MIYKKKYRQGWSSYDCDSFDHLDILYKYTNEQKKKDYIKDKLLKPKEIRLFDKRKWTDDYILKYELGRNISWHLPTDFTNEALRDWRNSILGEIDKKLSEKGGVE